MAATTTTTHPSWCCRDELGEPDPRVHRSERISVDCGSGGGTADVVIEQRAREHGAPESAETSPHIVLTTPEGFREQFTPEAARELAIALLRQNYAAFGSASTTSMTQHPGS